MVSFIVDIKELNIFAEPLIDRRESQRGPNGADTSGYSARRPEILTTTQSDTERMRRILNTRLMRLDLITRTFRRYTEIF